MLHAGLPAFVVPAACVQPLLGGPREFYSRLLTLASGARERASLAALYLGVGADEVALAAALAARARSGVQVLVQLDYSRALRSGAPGAAGHTSSVQLLAAAQRAADCEGANFRVGLTRLPQLRGWLGDALPPRYVEGLGVQHIKAFAFDDDVLLSGANLSADYFTNRQDRYVLISGVPAFASYMHGLMASLHELPGSHVLESCDGSGSDGIGGNGVSDTVSCTGRFNARVTVNSAESQGWRRRMEEALGVRLHPPSPPISAPAAAPPPLLPRNVAATRSGIHESLDVLPHVDASARSSTAQDAAFSAALAELAASCSCGDSGAAPGPALGAAPCTATLRPRLQAGTVGVRADEEATVRLLRAVGAAPSEALHVATGYFNLPPRYTRTLLHEMHAGSAVHILTASPQANGFYRSAGPSSALPTYYSESARRFHEAAVASGRASDDPLLRGVGPRSSAAGVALYEYKRPGWTFHGKGVWWDCAGGGAVSLVGSPNYGARSLERDLELNVEIATDDATLSARLRAEREALWTGDSGKGDGGDSQPHSAVVGSNLDARVYPGANVWHAASPRRLDGMLTWDRGFWIALAGWLLASLL